MQPINYAFTNLIAYGNLTKGPTLFLLHCLCASDASYRTTEKENCMPAMRPIESQRKRKCTFFHFLTDHWKFELLNNENRYWAPGSK